MESMHLLEALRSAPFGLALIDLEERYLYASGAYSERLGLDSEKIIGMQVKDCMDASNYEDDVAPRLRKSLNGELVGYQIESTLEQSDRLLSVRYIPCLDKNNHVWAVLIFGVDITSDCRASEETHSDAKEYWQKHLQNPVGSIYLDAKDVQCKLEYEERLLNVGRASAMQNHELRNPLSTLAASLKLLRAHLPDTTEVNGIISRSDRAMQRCESVMSTLLDYSKPFPLHPQKFNFDEWISTVINDYHFPESISVSWHPGDSGTVWFDLELMRRAVTNLLDNSVKEVLLLPQSAARELRIASYLAVGRLCLSITDSGPGFPKELHSDAEQKAPTNDATNLGFGLLIARQVIERHGGRLILGNNDDGGAVAEIQLPRLAIQAS